MEKIKESIRIRPLNAVLMVISAALYMINNLVLKDISSGIPREFFTGYFNDLLCPLFILPYANILLITVGKELKRFSHILLVCLGGSVIWELLAPLYKAGSVRDIWDVACYLIGGSVYWWMLSKALEKGELKN